MRTSILLVGILLGSILCKAQSEVGVFYGSTDGSESISLHLGKATSGPSQFKLYTQDGGAGIMKIYSYRWGGDFIWSRNSSGGIERPIARLYGGSGASYFDLYDYDQNVKIKLKASGASYFNAGNLGVGTEEPTSKLDVRGDLVLDPGSHPRIYTGTGSSELNRYLYILNSPSSSTASGMKTGGILISDTYSYSNPSKNDLIVKGIVGIGIPNPNPAYKLTVNGIISASEVRVSNTPNSDYVFEPDYNLLPITQVETFIKENKHLPEIPSAEEFKEKGVGLGEMDDMLLRKVEELTLYVIEQNKRIEKLEKVNAYHKEENIALKNELKNIKDEIEK